MTQYALVSVFDKTGISELARALHRAGYTILSTGGTAKHLRDEGIDVLNVRELTGFPEIFDGRVKTLHPRIFGGILARRHIVRDLEEMKRHDIPDIRVVVVNLYPFQEKLEEHDFEALMEWIDIGGPSMVRASAKNWKDVIILTHPDQYGELIPILEKGEWPSDELRKRWAFEAFLHTAHYDALISWRFQQELSIPFGKTLPIPVLRVQELRYGENPHQSAVWYGLSTPVLPALHKAKVLHGKPLSYNNILDLDAGVRLAGDLARDTSLFSAVVIKHNSPCGVARADTRHEAYRLAREADAKSAFGGIVALPFEVDLTTAEVLAETFIECVIAYRFDDDALEFLRTKKKNLRILELPSPWKPVHSLEIRSVLGGVLVQTGDWLDETTKQWKVVTKHQPDKDTMKALAFAWLVVKHAKSNAVVLTNAHQTLGIGAGQVSRVDAVDIALQKAGSHADGSVAASDAFFPFRDSIDLMAKHGVRAVIQPGGSIRDEEVIAACNEHGIAMVFTGIRHFRH